MNEKVLTVLVVLLIAFAIVSGFYAKSQLDRINDKFGSVDLFDIEIIKSIDRQAAVLDSVKTRADSNAAAIKWIVKNLDDDD